MMTRPRAHAAAAVALLAANLVTLAIAWQHRAFAAVSLLLVAAQILNFRTYRRHTRPASRT